MQSDRNRALLARTSGRLWLSDGGLETAMVFHEGIDLPQFAAFPLLDSDRGRAALARYFKGFLDRAAELGAGFVLDTVTWRASRGWGEVMGLDADRIDAANRAAFAFADGQRRARADVDVLVNGVVGPHGDAYAPGRELEADEAEDYHARQVAVLAKAGVDMVSAITFPAPGEAIGFVRAAQAAGVPAVVSFTVETDGKLLSGHTIGEAIAATEAATSGYPVWYGINCAHPEHFQGSLAGDWTARIGAIRANASRLSHAELDAAEELDAGDPEELARDYAGLLALLPGLRVVGGCCGTDLRHVSAIGRTCCGQARAA
jgi:S-methylmethionine-dependent homocysteine/selenocysteine methylase